MDAYEMRIKDLAEIRDWGIRNIRCGKTHYTRIYGAKEAEKRTNNIRVIVNFINAIFNQIGETNEIKRKGDI